MIITNNISSILSGISASGELQHEFDVVIISNGKPKNNIFNNFTNLIRERIEIKGFSQVNTTYLTATNNNEEILFYENEVLLPRKVLIEKLTKT